MVSRNFLHLKESSDSLNSVNFNLKNYLHDISEMNSVNFETCTDPNQMWYMWKSKFIELINVHAPLKTRMVGKKVQPWITKEILDSKRNKNFLKKSFQN